MPSLVAVRLPPGRAFLEAWDRIWSAGDAMLPLPVDAPDAVVARLVDELRPTALVVPPPGQPEATRVVRLEGGRGVEEGVGLVVGTSGSTAAPKGVVLSRAAIDATVAASLDRLDAKDGAVWLSCLPLHHTAGLLTVLRSRARRVEPIVHARFDVEAVRADVEGVSNASLVPTQLTRLLDAAVDLSNLDTVLLGGAAASSRLLERAEESGVRVVTSYGMTETCGGCVYDGLPLDGVTIGVDGRGAIRVKGPALCDGYRDGRTGRVAPLAPLATLDASGTVARLEAPGGDWLETEDLGRIEGGRLVVVGRRDDVIVTGGENVSAAAISERLREHPTVRDAVVTGVPDTEWGAKVVATVVCPGPRPTEGDLRAHVVETLGRAAAPRQFVFVERIPRTALDKPDRPGLLELR